MDKVTDWNRKRAEELNVTTNPEQWIWFEHPKHADWINKQSLFDFIEAAERHGVDPYYMLGMGMVESHLGNLHPSNPARINWDVHEPALRKLGIFEDQGTQESIRSGLIDFAARLLKEHFTKYPNDPISALQAYSGKGKTLYGGNSAVVKDLYGTTKMFGKPFQKIDFWKEKPQGKAAYELATLLKDNAAVRQIVENPKMRFQINNYLTQEEMKEAEEEEPTGLLKQLQWQ
jgi:hypothetical protein